MPVQTILDGDRNVVVKIDDTTAGTGIAIDVSALDPPCTRVNINRVWFSCPDGGGCTLTWDATAGVVAATLNESQDFCFDFFGGLTNNAGAGVTGDVLYTAIGTGPFTVVIHATKRGVISYPL